MGFETFDTSFEKAASQEKEQTKKWTADDFYTALKQQTAAIIRTTAYIYPEINNFSRTPVMVTIALFGTAAHQAGTIFYGVSIQSPLDQPNKKRGRTIAVGRLVESLNEPTRSNKWFGHFSEYTRKEAFDKILVFVRMIDEFRRIDFPFERDETNRCFFLNPKVQE